MCPSLRVAAVAAILFASTPAFASPLLVSDGSDGAFNPGPGSVVIDLTLPGREDGILNFTTINIPSTTSVTVKGNAANTPLFLLAQGSVVINGTINVSASGGAAGPGGGAGGTGGNGDQGCATPDCRNAAKGAGVLGGNAGPNAVTGGIKSTPGYAGSGGGMATAGAAADPARFSRSAPATGFLDQLPLPFTGGSGGGGGGGWMFFGVELGGGAGGAGGGALAIITPGDVTLGGTLRANGGNGGWGFTNSGGTGGPGGGGSGGNFMVVGDSVTVLDTAVIEAVGGWGGCLSTEVCDRDRATYSKLNNGGEGFFALTGRNVEVGGAATIKAVLTVNAVPLPPSLGMLAGALVALLAVQHGTRARAET